MAMTLRLDAETSARLRALSQRTGRSQQQIVLESVRVHLSGEDMEQARRSRRWRALLRRAGAARLVPATGESSPLFYEPELDGGRDVRVQAMVDAGFLHPPKYPYRKSEFRIIPPPGGVMAMLDREDRV